MQRVHWDPEFARRSGNPTTFDYGRMRETWLIHLCTDWMGDDAWLWKLDCEFRRFNYVGDTQWLRRHGDAQVPRRTATGPPWTSSFGPRTSATSSRRRATPRSCCRAASTDRFVCRIRPAAPPICRARSTRSPRFERRDATLDIDPEGRRGLVAPSERGSTRTCRRTGATRRNAAARRRSAKCGPGAEYEAWYPVFGRSGLVVPAWPVEYGGLGVSPARRSGHRRRVAPLQPRPAQPPRV